MGIDRREFVDLAAEFGVQRPNAFAAAADMGFGDDDYIAHPFPLWFVKRSGARGAVMKAEYRDILAGMFESLAESSRSRMVDRRRRRPSMLVLQKELVEYRRGRIDGGNTSAAGVDRKKTLLRKPSNQMFEPSWRDRR